MRKIARKSEIDLEVDACLSNAVPLLRKQLSAKAKKGSMGSLCCRLPPTLTYGPKGSCA